MTEAGRHPIRVLVIDDDPDAILVMRHILAGRGHMAVTTVSGPGEGLELLDTTAFDIVVTDVQMPGMTGLQLLHLLQLTSPRLPVVVVTSNIGVDSAIDVLRARAAGFLFKPVEADQLLRTVTMLVRAAAGHRPDAPPAVTRPGI